MEDFVISLTLIPMRIVIEIIHVIQSSLVLCENILCIVCATNSMVRRVCCCKSDTCGYVILTILEDYECFIVNSASVLDFFLYFSREALKCFIVP